MADNVTANAGSGGAVFASDDIAGVHYPLTKLAWGALDTANIVDDASGKRVPVDLGEAASTIAAGAPTAADNSANSTTKVPVLVAKATAATQSYSEGSQVPLSTTLAGVLRITGGQTASGDGATVSQTLYVHAAALAYNGTTFDRMRGDITNGLDVDVTRLPGDAVHDAPDAGNPIKIGYKGVTADPAAASANDRVNALADTLGKSVVHIGALNENAIDGKGTFTTATAADLIAAVASTKIAVTSILVTNAHATVGTKVEIRDGTTVKVQGFAAANGGGFALNAGGRPLFIGAAGVAITGRCVTTGADVDIHVSGYKTTV